MTKYNNNGDLDLIYHIEMLLFIYKQKKNQQQNRIERKRDDIEMCIELG